MYLLVYLFPFFLLLPAYFFKASFLIRFFILASALYAFLLLAYRVGVGWDYYSYYNSYVSGVV